MDQITFSEAEYQTKKHKTRRETFLERLDKLTHSIDTTAANVHDIVPARKLLHGEEQQFFGDAGYLGIQKRDEHKHREDVSWFIAKPEEAGCRQTESRKLNVPKWSIPSGTSSRSLIVVRSAIAALQRTTAGCIYLPRSAICG